MNLDVEWAAIGFGNLRSREEFIQFNTSPTRSFVSWTFRSNQVGTPLRGVRLQTAVGEAVCQLLPAAGATPNSGPGEALLVRIRSFHEIVPHIVAADAAGIVSGRFL